MTENFAENAGQTSDTRMIERAVAQRWPIKPEFRAVIINRAMRIITDPKASPREVDRASRTLLTADKLNIAAEAEGVLGGNAPSMSVAQHIHQHLHLHGPSPALIGLAKRLEAGDATEPERG